MRFRSALASPSSFHNAEAISPEVQAALEKLTGREVLLISAVTGQNLNVLVQKITAALDA